MSIVHRVPLIANANPAQQAGRASDYSPPAGDWPNEPAGFSLVTDFGFPSMPSGNWDWNGGYKAIVDDVTAPQSPNKVFRVEYPSGYAGGESPANAWYNGSLPSGEFYVGFWWKCSDPWDGHSSGVNKLLFITWNPACNLYFQANGVDTDDLYSVMTKELAPCTGEGSENLFGGGVLTRGVWHQIEIYIKESTTTSSADGIIRWWVNNVLRGNYTSENTGTSYLDGIQFSPTWGGAGDTKAQTDYFWFDHVRISQA